MSFSFICPQCRARLKVRDDSVVGTRLDCPECHTLLLVATSADGALVAEQVPVETPPVSAPATGKSGRRSQPGASQSPASPQKSQGKFEPPPGLHAGSKTPQIVAWVVAGVCLLGLIPFLLPSRSSVDKPADKVADAGAKPAEEPRENGANKKPAEPPVIAGPAAPPPKPAIVPLPDSPEGRLLELGKLVLEDVRRDGHFPAGTVPAPGLMTTQRWSWLAQQAARHDNPQAVGIIWTERWNHPSQDPFVRRPIPRFQNPAVKNKVSEDRYPATHFVGVAGVGPDAPTLPVDHPRAGIFGRDRQTKLDDVKDGTSNTMLLAGVEEQLGSWAAGPSGYRPLTREPYIHGPDGFGTGQPDSMFVLMADGSVRQLNGKTDPRIVRRMAAMNDGFSLDPEIDGEPGDPRPGTVAVPDPLTAKVKPVTPMPQAPDATGNGQAAIANDKPIDIDAALSRKILKFDQAKPAEAYRLLLQIEELAGVRIEYDRDKLGAAAARLDKMVTLRKENASLKELLDDILKQIDLQQKPEAKCIRIVAPEST